AMVSGEVFAKLCWSLASSSSLYRHLPHPISQMHLIPKILGTNPQPVSHPRTLACHLGAVSLAYLNHNCGSCRVGMNPARDDKRQTSRGPSDRNNRQQPRQSM